MQHVHVTSQGVVISFHLLLADGQLPVAVCYSQSVWQHLNWFPTYHLFFFDTIVATLRKHAHVDRNQCEIIRTMLSMRLRRLCLPSMLFVPFLRWACFVLFVFKKRVNCLPRRSSWKKKTWNLALRSTLGSDYANNQRWKGNIPLRPNTQSTTKPEATTSIANIYKRQETRDAWGREGQVTGRQKNLTLSLSLSRASLITLFTSSSPSLHLDCLFHCQQ